MCDFSLQLKVEIINIFYLILIIMMFKQIAQCNGDGKTTSSEHILVPYKRNQNKEKENIAFS